MEITLRSRLWLGAVLLAFSVAAAAQNAITTESADLYAGPDDSYPVVAQLDSNTSLQVMGCLDDWSWCDVDVGGARGWLFAPAITYRYEGGYVPLYAYAPSLGIAIEPFALDDYWGRHYHDRPWYRRRDEWVHRTVPHRRPSGPPPSVGPPPRPDHNDRPREAARPDEQSLRLGRAEPSPRNEAPHGDRNARPDGVKPEPRPEPHAVPTPAPAPLHEDSSHVPGRDAPPRHEEHPRPHEQPGPQKEEEHPR